MRYDPATRIMTLSFIRSPEEHADVMMEAGKRLLRKTDAVSPWTPFFVTIGVGAVVGITMEFYRRLVLPYILDQAEIVPLGAIAVQILPLILLAIAFYVVLLIRLTAGRRRMLIGKLESKLFIDTEVYENGISTSSGQFTVEIDWLAVKNVIAGEHRIEVESEGYVIYFPERAFKSRAEFNEAATTMKNLWREARKRERDAALIRAEKVQSHLH